MEHTEGKLEHGHIYDWELWIGADYHIADVHGNLSTRHANATELVRRWNAFEEGGIVSDLIEACDESRALLSHGVGQHTHVIAKIEAALAKAKES